MTNTNNGNDDNNENEHITLRPVNTIQEIDAKIWNKLAKSGGRFLNPFIAHEFLNILEESGSVKAQTGWMPYHLVLEKTDKFKKAKTIIGVAPTYLKNHSQGEYVFDHHWGDAYQRAGGQYYPKLVIASPFTPVPGPRLLCENETDIPLFSNAIAQLTQQIGLSSAHVNFISEEEHNILGEHGYLRRMGEQFHWHNRGYENFDGFLNALTSRKRKTIRQERRKAMSDDISIHSLTGDDIKPHHWDAFWEFYQDTGARKWGTPYLTREAFTLMGERMGEQLLLMMAYHKDDPNPIAGALHIIGEDTLYGRYWGCREQAKFLHFECCYYLAIEYAIKHKLARVEAGAQGHHKLARGYEPIATYSAHYIPDPNFNTAIAHYLDQERLGTAEEIHALKDYTPFKKDQ